MPISHDMLEDTLEVWRQRANERSRSTFQFIASIRLHGLTDKVADETNKAVCMSDGDVPIYFVLATHATANDIVKRGAENSAMIRSALPDPLRLAILAPESTEVLDGIRVAAYRYHRPLSRTRAIRHGQDIVMLPSVTRWLCEVANVTRTPAPHDGTVAQDLGGLLSCHELPPELLEQASQALEHVENGRWVPQRTLMHGDLWRDNILQAHAGRQGSRFVIIDWPSGTLRGYPFYDLIRLLLSFSMSQLYSRRAIARLCNSVGCQANEIQWYLAAAMGSLRIHLNNFRYDRYLQLVMRTFNVARRFVDSKAALLELDSNAVVPSIPSQD